MRTEPPQGELFEAVSKENIKIVCGYTVTEALPDRGKRGIRAAIVNKIPGESISCGKQLRIPCDLICMSVGYSPAAQLLCHAGSKLEYDENFASLRVKQIPGNNIFITGSLNSIFTLDAVTVDGQNAGWQAAMHAGFENDLKPETALKQGDIKLNHPWPIFPHSKEMEFVDMDEDLHIRDIQNAVAHGYADLELVKRYSTVVMGPSQGRQSALNNLRIANKAQGNELDGVTVTTQRPPYYPEPVQLLAGRRFQPVRKTAIHHRHIELGAKMMSAGLWSRPAYYGKESQKAECIRQESMAVRQNVGIIDVSTLGKLEIHGHDAAEFLNRMYTFAYIKQPLNRSRYVLMTDETGAIIDDGVACRFGEGHFYVTTTTGGMEMVYRSMLRWNAQWRLDIHITNVTSAYAAVNIAGPKVSRCTGSIE